MKLQEIRFIDRSEIGEDGISLHEVRNDLANLQLAMRS
jgi:hypothetical protein